jgi:plastocyanin
MAAAILFIVGTVLLIVWAIDSGRTRGGDDEAIQILRARFARGEIDDDQLTTAKETLGRSQRSTTPSRGSLLLGAGLLIAGLILGLIGWASFGGYGGMMGPGMMGMMGPAPTAPAGTSVTLAGSRFMPATLSIKVGDTVRWFNDDALPHTVTAADHSWDSGPLGPGASFERRFDVAGTYAYVCLYHSWMAGSIVVSTP